MPFFAPMPWEADRFFQPAGHGGEELHARLVAGRHRSLHACGERSERAHGARAQSRISAASPIRRRASRATPRAACSPTPARPCRSSTRRSTPGKRKAFRSGTSSCRATTTFRASARTTSTRRCASSMDGEAALTPEMEARGIRLDTTIAPTVYYLGVNWLDPVVGGNSRARSQAAPGAGDRGRLGGIPVHLRQRPRRAVAQPACARHLRLSRGRGRASTR